MNSEIKLAENIARAVVDGKPLEPRYRAAVEVPDVDTVRIFSVMPCDVTVYSKSSGVQSVSDWNVLQKAELPPNEPVNIRRRRHGPDAGESGVKLFLKGHQMFDVEYGSTFVYDGQNMIRVYSQDGSASGL